MALEFELDNKALGIVLPDAYLKITGMYVDAVAGIVRMNVRVYSNGDVRQGDVDIKRTNLERQLLDAKDRMVGLRKTLLELESESVPQDDLISEVQSNLNAVSQDVITLDEQILSATGTIPILETKMEFPLDSNLLNSFLQQGYAQLKQSRIDYISNGASMTADLTTARDV